jgi:hypothetical protein
MRGSDGLVKEEARFWEKRGALASPSHQADDKPCFCMQMGVVDKLLERRICGESSCEESGENINKTLEDYSSPGPQQTSSLTWWALELWNGSRWRWDGGNTRIPTSPTCPVQRSG